jgi:hypothetical protein
MSIIIVVTFFVAVVGVLILTYERAGNKRKKSGRGGDFEG